MENNSFSIFHFSFCKCGVIMENSGENKKSVMHELKDWVVSIVIAIALALLIRHYVVELYIVEGPSMLPTLSHGERLIVNKFIYCLRSPERGEVLIFRYPRNPERDFIKRVIAVPGDTVRIKDGNVFVNNALLNEDYILEQTRGSHSDATVPAGHYYVMGDNRNNSEDSRFADVGFVPHELIKGKAVAIFWPLNNMKTLP
jgi:signal peptidase I